MQHLDRCLTCRSCMTTCPSGVEYAQLLDIGRHLVERKVSRPLLQRIKRKALHWLLRKPERFARLFGLANKFANLVPNKFKVNAHPASLPKPTGKPQPRKVLLLAGCVQPVMQPDINIATQRILEQLGIQSTIVAQVKCCGAISHHLNEHETALQTMRSNIDAWLPYLSQGYEAIVSNASGCGITLREYAQYLEHDAQYAQKARQISECVRDISQFISAADIDKLKLPHPVSVAFHPPCTLQHGLKLGDRVQQLLQRLGFECLPVNDSHLCCGSAGTYSLLQPELAEELKNLKLANLEANRPEYIVTANIGCQHHLASQSSVPVLHWVELVARYLD